MREEVKPWMVALLGAMTVPEARRIVLEYTEMSSEPIRRDHAQKPPPV